MTFNPKDSLQLSGMTLSARGRRSSKEASSTNAWISGYDITAQLAKKKKWGERGKDHFIGQEEQGEKDKLKQFTILAVEKCRLCLCVPVNPPMDQAYTTMSLSWKPSLCIAYWITTSMALASFWGNGTPCRKIQVKKQYSCIIKQNSNTQPQTQIHALLKS